MINVTDKIANRAKSGIISPEKVIAKYPNCSFVGVLCIKDSPSEPSQWINTEAFVFYNPNPQIELGHSNYFAFLKHPLRGNIVIVDGQSAVSKPIMSIFDNGQYHYSAYRYDYVETPSGKIIDGGRDYCRSNCDIIPLQIIDGQWFLLEEH